jgi:hypothetical protein
MSGQIAARRIFIWVVCLFVALTIALAFSGCPDPIRALDDSRVENPETPPPDPSVTVADAESLKAALENSSTTTVEVVPNASLTVAGVTVGTDKSLKIPSSSIVTIYGLSVPAGTSLGLYREGEDPVAQIVLSSLNIGGTLSVFDGTQVTLEGTGNKVQGKLDLYGGTVVFNSGGKIEGTDAAGRINVYTGVVFINEGDNNFYKIDGSRMNPPKGIFSWNSGKGWVETLEKYPGSLQEFFAANYATTYVAREDESLFTTETVLAAFDPPGEKILVLNNMLTGDSLTLQAGAKLKLEGSGLFNSKKITLEDGAGLEVAPGVTFYANEDKDSKLKQGSEIVIRGVFYNTMESWDMGQESKFVFHAGSKIYKRESPFTSTKLIGGGIEGAVITLKSGCIVLEPSRFLLEGTAVLNADFRQPWPGGFYIDGTLELHKELIVEQPNSPQGPYFELAPGATVLVHNGGSLVVEGPSAGGSAEYGRLEGNSRIVVESGGSFYNYIFPNWAHGGTGNGQGAFVFEAGANVYAPESAFYSSGTGDKLYIGGSGSNNPVVKLEKGQIRLTDKTFTLKSDTGVKAEATINDDFTLSGAKLVLENSNLTIASGKKFTVENQSGVEFVTLTKGTVTVNGEFEITGSQPAPGGNGKLAYLNSGSEITVEDKGIFRNGIYPYWDISKGDNKFVFNAGSKIYKDGETAEFIGGSGGTIPIQLTEGTITYSYNQITLDGKAKVYELNELPLWNGFTLFLKENSVLTVKSPTKGDFTIQGINLTTDGVGDSRGKIVYTNTP